MRATYYLTCEPQASKQFAGALKRRGCKVSRRGERLPVRAGPDMVR